jgi:protein SMG6
MYVATSGEDRRAELKVLDIEEGGQLTDGIIEDEDEDDEGGGEGKNENTRRWTRVRWRRSEEDRHAREELP